MCVCVCVCVCVHNRMGTMLKRGWNERRSTAATTVTTSQRSQWAHYCVCGGGLGTQQGAA